MKPHHQNKNNVFKLPWEICHRKHWINESVQEHSKQQDHIQCPRDLRRNNNIRSPRVDQCFASVKHTGIFTQRARKHSAWGYTDYIRKSEAHEAFKNTGVTLLPLVIYRFSQAYAYAPTSNNASYDNHEKINSWVYFAFLYGYGVPLGGTSDRRSSATTLILDIHVLINWQQ